MNEQPIAEKDAALYGLCVVCRAARTVLRTVHDDGVNFAMVCSVDAIHDQDATYVLPPGRGAIS